MREKQAKEDRRKERGNTATADMEKRHEKEIALVNKHQTFTTFM